MKNRERGLSLVEVLIAIMILLVGIIPLMRLLMFSLRTGNRAHVMSVATNLARGMGEEIRTKAFSEEFTVEFTGDPDLYYPDTTTPQSFGVEETFTLGDTRFDVFNDVDDYNNWCRGPDCDCTGITPAALCDTSPVETYDGHKYDGTKGFPNYQRYTRRVRVFNVTVRPEFTYQRAIYENLSGNVVTINRYDLEETNFPNLTTGAAGQSPLKLIEVTVSYQAAAGITQEDMEVKDVSMAVMPLIVGEEED